MIRTIVVPVDFSQPSHAAVRRASSIAERHGAALHLLHAVRCPAPAMSHEFAIPGPEFEKIRDAAQQRVDRIAARLEGHGLRVTREVSEHSTADAIAAAVEHYDAELIVMGTHGHSGFQHFVLGSVAERVVRTSKVPVMAVKEDEERAARPIRRILFATDFSEPAARAREFAVALARDGGAEIRLAHVVPHPTHYLAPYDIAAPEPLADQLHQAAEDKLQREAAAIAEQGVEVSKILADGVPAEAISEAAAKFDADAIVMGTRGNTGLRHVLLGSVAERTLQNARCSVVVVRPRE